MSTNTPISGLTPTVILQGVSSNPAPGGATSVPPGILALPSGTLLRGRITSIDTLGNAIMHTAKGELTLKTNLPLQKGNDVIIRLDTTSSGLNARIISVDGLTPKELQQQIPRTTGHPVEDIVDTLGQKTSAENKPSLPVETKAPPFRPLPPPVDVKLPQEVLLRAVLLSRAPELLQLLQQLPASIPLTPDKLDTGAHIMLKLLPQTIQLPATNPAASGSISPGIATALLGIHGTPSATNTTGTPSVSPSTAAPASTPPTATPASPATIAGGSIPAPPSSGIPAAHPSAPGGTAATATGTSSTTPAVSASASAIPSGPTITTSPQAATPPGTTVTATPAMPPAGSPASTPTTGTTPTAASTPATPSPIAATPNTAPTSALTEATAVTSPPPTTGNAPATTPPAGIPAASPSPPTPPPAQLLQQGLLPAQVIGTEQSGETVVKTPLGTIKLDLPLISGERPVLPPGTQMTLQLVTLEPALPTTSAIPVTTTGTPAPLSELTSHWHSLRETLEVIQQANPALAQQIIDSIIPQPGPKMAATMLFFIAALRGGDMKHWLGRQTMETLEQLQRGDLINRLGAEFASLRQFFVDSPSPNWQAAFVPVHHDGEWQQSRLFIRKEPKDQENKGEQIGTRFIVEVDLSNLGPMQFDGFIRKKQQATQFDLIIRSHTALPEQDRQAIRDIFSNASEITGFNGGISFQVGRPFPVNPMEEIIAHGKDVMA